MMKSLMAALVSISMLWLNLPHTLAQNTDLLTSVVEIKTYSLTNNETDVQRIGIEDGKKLSDSGLIVTHYHDLLDQDGELADIIEICYPGSIQDSQCDEIASIIASDKTLDLALLNPVGRYNSSTEEYEETDSAAIQNYGDTLAAIDQALEENSTISSSEAFLALENAIFTDVSNNALYSEAIQFLKENSIVGGYPDGSFKPLNTINRAEFVKILIEAVFDSVTIDTCLITLTELFRDVPRGEWFAKYVCMAKRYGIVAGYPDGSFGAGNTINFAEAAKIIVNTLKVPTPALQDGQQWFEPFIQALRDQGAIPDSLTDPNQGITRGEMSEIIFRLKAFLNTAANKQTVVSESSSENPSEAPEASTDGSVQQLRNEVLGLVNQERAKEGLAPMRHSALLEQSAQEHSDDMRQQGYFAHNSLDGRTPNQRIEAIGYLQPFFDCVCTKSTSTGENIAKGQDTAALVMETWMASPQHRANILDPDFDEIGIGITAVDPNESFFEGYLWVQNFGVINLQQ